MSVALATIWEERLADLGNVLASRVVEGQTLDGGKVLPDWQVDVAELFSRLDRGADTQ